ncbi:MAG: hypothetical protein RMI90_02775 [Thermoguttaceae bacterium]|nr:hypothetical protein [Thermoguttaceae bacterium]
MTIVAGGFECPNCHEKLAVWEVCPYCGSRHLKRSERPSLLDGAYGSECLQCGAQFAPDCPLGWIIGLMIFAGAITLFSIGVLVYMANTKEGLEIGSQIRRFWLLLLGPIVGPIVIIHLLHTLYARNRSLRKNTSGGNKRNARRSPPHNRPRRASVVRIPKVGTTTLHNRGSAVS